MILYAVGLIVVLVAAIALYALQTEHRTRPAQWSLLVLIAGIVITTIAFWTQHSDPGNTLVMTWTLLITAAVLALAASAAEVVSRIVRWVEAEPRDTDIIDNPAHAPSGDRA
ncbi:hypothetical protein CH286_25180 [Rhodococcus sp. WWJCD1]|uniref:hypothetical protein n=1 Tax=unclassified Rhodococcus (in: high G+C Gram-positive bacteria) TaxID=192944 RepID=UPI000B9BAB58|nr:MULTISPECIES: hypothetical protein [unclassified Rhodococcus (in: high G+C Gram-positive bacteria)]OZC42466.1 hypothetical protein CH286_25180 [Rhodococcus sp. WWJCD1]OZE89308.1 hypothetical protein CH302_28425 [Rhodococcus sp. 15-2388-1-1a]